MQGIRLWFSTGDIGQCLEDTLLVITTGGISWLETGDTARHAMIYRTVRAVKNHPAQSVDSAKGEKPWGMARWDVLYVRGQKTSGSHSYLLLPK